MEENNVDVKKQMGILQTVKALIEVQAVLAKVNAQIAIKEGKIMVQSAVDDAKETIKEQKSKLGKSIEKMEEEYLSEKEDKKNVLEEYKGILGEIDDMYNEVLEGILAQRTEKETQESQIMLKENENIAEIKGLKLDEKKLREQLSKITKKEDMETIKDKVNELEEINKNIEALKKENEQLEEERKDLRSEIEKLDKDYADILQEKSEKISGAVINRQEQMMVVKKQNIFSKFIGMFSNKFKSGKTKFKENAIDPMMKKIDHIKEETIPEAKKSLDKKREKLGQKIANQQKKFKDIVKSAKQKKMDILLKAQNSIEGKRDEIEAKKQLLMESDLQEVSDNKEEILVEEEQETQEQEER